jgi:hypothetical protein
MNLQMKWSCVERLEARWGYQVLPVPGRLVHGGLGRLDK